MTIGSKLREARMSQNIDVTDVEAYTKIRAKFLRSLESEEWDSVGDDTLIKSFLSTYAEYLGLDPRQLVEEFSLLRGTESHLMSPMHATRGKQPNDSQFAQRAALALGLVGLAGLLIWIGGGH
jgi:cytoskeletal protein RodZ